MIKFRKPEDSDAQLLEAWIHSDRDHNGRMTAEFFMQRDQGISCFVIEDEEGPVLFVRNENEMPDLRIHLQLIDDRKRVREAILEAFPMVAEDARQRGFKRIVSETGAIALMRLMAGLGFRADLYAPI